MSETEEVKKEEAKPSENESQKVGEEKKPEDMEGKILKK